MIDEDLRTEELRQLQEALRRLFGAAAREDAFGAGDFWVVDDDWGDTNAKVTIQEISALTPRVVEAIQGRLRELSLDWRVLIQLELGKFGYPDPKGLIVSSRQIEECWDRSLMRKTFGDSFEW